jgi:hypothetical protein
MMDSKVCCELPISTIRDGARLLLFGGRRYELSESRVERLRHAGLFFCRRFPCRRFPFGADCSLPSFPCGPSLGAAGLFGSL